MVIIIWEDHLENPNFGKTMGILYVFLKYWGIIQIGIVFFRDFGLWNQEWDFGIQSI